VYAVWLVLRFLLALAGVALFVAAATSLFGWFALTVGGTEVAWYWLLAASFILGFLGMAGDKFFD
jgi:hypothetical protein